MGAISNLTTEFKSAEYIYTKIKRQWASFDSVNILDDTDFPLYTAEVLQSLGMGVLKESDAFLPIKDDKAKLPDDFKLLHAAYKCSGCKVESVRKNLQNTQIFENNVTKELINRHDKCEIQCECTDEIIEKITIRQYVNDCAESYSYSNVGLLRLSPNVRKYCADNCANINSSSSDEITINNKHIITNFQDGDIYIQYYAFPKDDNGIPMIPDVIQVERAVEWYIKWQVMLNYWLVDELQNAQTKWQKAEQMYTEAFAEAKYLNKLPGFQTMINGLRNRRAINKHSFFSQIERKNPNKRTY